MRTLALFLPNWIGDVVMATPAVRALRDQFPGARLVAVTKPYVADTLAGAPWFDDAVLFDKGGRREHRFVGAVRRLAALGADAAVLFPNSFRAALAARLAGCTTVVGFARYGRDALLTHRLYPRRGPDGRPAPTPMVDDYNRLAVRLGAPDPGHRLELFTTPADEAAAAAAWVALGLSRFHRVVSLNPGGAFGASKHWPTAHFAGLARRLAARPGTGVVVLCGPAERDEARAIVAAAGHPGVVSLADRALSIGLTKAAVRRSDLLVTTDSGPRHFAAAFNVPVVTLFGPTHVGWTETYFDRAVHLQLDLPCGPCQKRACPLGHHRCMVDLLPDAALAAADALSATHAWGTHRAS